MTTEQDGARLAFVPLSQIRYNPAINARRDTETDIGELAATIDARKIGQPLLLRPADEAYEPVDGGRRFRALSYLAGQGKISADMPVPALIRELSDDEALTLSLSTAITRLDLNPADEALSFADLARMGHDVEEIAAIFGVPVRRVKQRLAIGQLSKPIVDALRVGDIDLRTAQAYTLLNDPARALKMFEKGITDDWQIRNEFSKSRVPAESREAAYIGEDAYRAAGGAVDEDLFSNNKWFADGKLLSKLFEKKLKDDEKRWLDEGWSFVIVDADIYSSKTERWGWLEPEGKPNLSKEQSARATELRKLINAAKKQKEPEPRMGEWQDELDALTAKFFTDAQKKKSGVVVRYTHHKIEVQFGKMKPSAAKPKAAQRKPSGSTRGSSAVRTIEPEAEADFTGALQAEMAKAMTHAMQHAIVVKHGLARRALCAALLTLTRETGCYPFHATVPYRALSIAQSTQDKLDVVAALFSDEIDLKAIPDIFAMMLNVDIETIDATIALATAALINITPSIAEDLQPMIEAFDPDVAAVWQPDEAFFKRMPRESLAAALGEAAVPGATPSKKKKELVEMALKSLVPVGWLPKPLRTPSYTGPGSNAWIEAHATKLADDATTQQQAAE